eukprot:scaffold6279_cov418-Prasinococcus_capsulatus_cf.AAC.5
MAHPTNSAAEVQGDLGFQAFWSGLTFNTSLSKAYTFHVPILGDITIDNIQIDCSGNYGNGVNLTSSLVDAETLSLNAQLGLQCSIPFEFVGKGEEDAIIQSIETLDLEIKTSADEADSAQSFPSTIFLSSCSVRLASRAGPIDTQLDDFELNGAGFLGKSTIVNLIKNKLPDIVNTDGCNALNNTLAGKGSAILEGLRDTLAPLAHPIAPVKEPSVNETQGPYIEWKDNFALACIDKALHYALTHNFSGGIRPTDGMVTDRPINLDWLIHNLTGDGEIDLLPKNISFSTHIAELPYAVVNVQLDLDSLKIANLDEVSDLSLLAPVQDYSLSSTLAMDSIELSLMAHYEVVLIDNNTWITDTAPWRDDVQLTVSASQLWIYTQVFLAAKPLQLRQWWFGRLDCVGQSVVDMQLSQLLLNGTFNVAFGTDTLQEGGLGPLLNNFLRLLFSGIDQEAIVPGLTQYVLEKFNVYSMVNSGISSIIEGLQQSAEQTDSCHAYPDIVIPHSLSSDVGEDVAAIVNKRLPGAAEEHRITTSDDFVLKAWKVAASAAVPYRGVVMLQHDIACQSQSWVVGDDANSSGVYFLASQGYDVWLVNTRQAAGPSNTKYGASDKQSWDWGFFEIVKYDLQQGIDYVLGHSPVQSINAFIGHGDGALMGWSGFSYYPALAEKVQLFVSMAALPPGFPGAEEHLEQQSNESPNAVMSIAHRISADRVFDIEGIEEVLAFLKHLRPGGMLSNNALTKPFAEGLVQAVTVNAFNLLLHKKTDKDFHPVEELFCPPCYDEYTGVLHAWPGCCSGFAAPFEAGNMWAADLCSDDVVGAESCYLLNCVLGGCGHLLESNVNLTRLSVFMGQFPAYISEAELLTSPSFAFLNDSQAGCGSNKSKWCAYDWGSPDENLSKYNQTSPPEYDISMLGVKTMYIYGLSDKLVSSDPKLHSQAIQYANKSGNVVSTLVY